MPQPLEVLHRRLLHAGVSGRRSRRYIAELADHFDDLLAEERASGTAREDAHLRALQRLGGVDALVDAMASRPEFRSLATRAPVAVYLVAPPLFLGLGTVCVLAGLVAACDALRGVEPPPGWLAPAASVLTASVDQGLPVLLGWAVAFTAVRRRTPWVWPGAGLLLLAVVSAAGQVAVTLPASGSPGEIHLLSELTPGPLTAAARQTALELGLMLLPCTAAVLRRVATSRSQGDRS